MKSILNLVCVVTVLAMSAPAFANGLLEIDDEFRRGRDGSERIVVDMYDAYYRQSSLVPLRRLVLDRLGMRLGSNYELEGVSVLAKSRHGKGTMALQVGPWVSYKQRVPGRPIGFDSSQRYTYTRMNLFNDSRRDSTRENWKLEMRGNIKIKKIVLHVRSKRGGRDGRVRTQTLTCESEDYRGAFCRAAGRVQHVVLIQQLSDRLCRQGTSWGYSEAGVWVTAGCRGVFTVYLQNNRRPGRRLLGRR